MELNKEDIYKALAKTQSSPLEYSGDSIVANVAEVGVIIGELFDHIEAQAREIEGIKEEIGERVDCGAIATLSYKTELVRENKELKEELSSLEKALKKVSEGFHRIDTENKELKDKLSKKDDEFQKLRKHDLSMRDNAHKFNKEVKALQAKYEDKKVAEFNHVTQLKMRVDTSISHYKDFSLDRDGKIHRVIILEE